MLMLMAYGPNNVQMPCRFFRDREEADAFLNQWMTPRFVHGHVFEGSSLWRVNDPMDAEDAGFYAALFTGYFGGCGHASAFELVEVPFNQPFLPWDLD